MSKQRNQRLRQGERIIQGLLLVLLIGSMVMMINNINKLQGSARIVNYAGIVRGATQRLVKLEISDSSNTELQNYLDDIVKGLQNGGSQYQLIKINDKEFQSKLSHLASYWVDLKLEISQVRELGPENTNILSMSEEYFYLADETVSAAEAYCEKIATYIRHTELVSIMVILCMAALLIRQTIVAIQISNANKVLSKKAFIDTSTGLLNRGRCDELINNHGCISQPTCVIMFDLNNLKAINDSLGHTAGDTLIINFAHIIHTVFSPVSDFVCRYGGDEFVVILNNTSQEEIIKLLNSVQDEVTQYNQSRREFPLSYAYGYATSISYPNFNLKSLLEKADRNMYINKRATKEKQNGVTT